MAGMKMSLGIADEINALQVKNLNKVVQVYKH